MRRISATGAFFCLLSIAGTSLIAETFPYTAFVNVEHAAIRSGPGPQFYATDELGWGTTVDVHRVDPGGWCAIRPPHGSFSWVAAAHLEATDDPTLAKVVSDQTVTYVGTRYSDQRDVEYVRLRHGELVEVMGQKQLTDSDEDETWYMIAPPAGEFRWVRRAHLSKTPPVGAAAVSRNQDQPKEADDSKTARAEVPSDDVEVDVDQRAEPEIDETRIAVASVSDDSSNSSGWTLQRIEHQPAKRDARADRAKAGENEDVEPTAGVSRADSTDLVKTPRNADSPRHAGILPATRTGWTVTSPTTTASLAELPGDSVPGDSVTGDSVPGELSAVSLELAHRVCGDTGAWHLEDLYDRIRTIADQATNAVHRSEATELLGRIAKFAEIKRRYDDLQGPSRLAGSVESQNSARPTEPAVLPILPEARPVNAMAQVTSTAEAALTAAESDSSIKTGLTTTRSTELSQANFQGSGWLMPVVSARREIPQYALTDKNGNVVQFVTPSPGLNLHRYLRQEVGIHGRSGFIPEFQKPHLTAQRVIVLDRHRR